VAEKEVNSGTGSGREVLLQGFNWESARRQGGSWYSVLRERAPELAAAGFTVIWLPPPTDSVSAEGYMPRDLYDLNSKYGGVEDLRIAVAALHDAGLKVLGDAVLNHRCAHYQGANGVWNRFGGRLAWDARAIVADDPHFAGQGNPSQGDFFHAAPNIDHTQAFVRRDICEWMRWLRDHVGYDGWRLDFVRGFSGVAVKEYMLATGPSFAVGEYWDTLAYHHSEPEHCQDAHRQRIVNWINAAGGTAGAFDVTTKGILHAALERREYWRLADASGKPPGVMGWWPSRAVTFIENHDTGSTQGHWRFPAGKELQGYAYILSHPGTPTVFWDHLFEWKHLAEPIKRLIALRKRAGVHCRSEIKILAAEREVYAAQMDSVLICKIGPGHFSAPDGWKMAEHGNDWATWERKDPPPQQAAAAPAAVPVAAGPATPAS
jgi:glycosidase